MDVVLARFGSLSKPTNPCDAWERSEADSRRFSNPAEQGRLREGGTASATLSRSTKYDVSEPSPSSSSSTLTAWAWSSGSRTRTLALLGRADEAHERAKLAKPLSTDDIVAVVGWLRAEALTRAAAGDILSAVARAEEAVRVAGLTDLVPTHGEAMLDLASLLAHAGRTDEALAAAMTARGLFEQKGHRVGINRAVRLISQHIQVAQPSR
jgi:hypothetical protein